MLDGKEYEGRVLDIGLKIGYYRRKTIMTQQQLAEEIDVSRTFISELEAPNIVCCPSIKLLIKLEKALGVPAYKFLQTDED